MNNKIIIPSEQWLRLGIIVFMVAIVFGLSFSVAQASHLRSYNIPYDEGVEVDITPDGTKAVVRMQPALVNSTKKDFMIIDLATGNLTHADSMYYTNSQHAIAVTNTRAVVLSSSNGGNSNVHIYNLADNPPSHFVEFNIPYHEGKEVDITPDGTKALIRMERPFTGPYNNDLLLINLVTGIIRHNELMYSAGSEHSIAVTNTRAVVLTAGNGSNPNVRIYNLDVDPPTLRDTHIISNLCGKEVDITPDGTKAIIRMQPSTLHPKDSAFLVIRLSTGEILYHDTMYYTASENSLAVTNTRAVALSSSNGTNSNVNIYNLDENPIRRSASYVFPYLEGKEVEITPDGTKAIVRMRPPTINSSSVNALLVIDLSSGIIIFNDAMYQPKGEHTLAVTNTRVVALDASNGSNDNVKIYSLNPPSLIESHCIPNHVGKEVEITPDGIYAIVRMQPPTIHPSDSAFLIIELDSGFITYNDEMYYTGSEHSVAVTNTRAVALSSSNGYNRNVSIYKLDGHVRSFKITGYSNDIGYSMCLRRLNGNPYDFEIHNLFMPGIQSGGDGSMFAHQITYEINNTAPVIGDPNWIEAEIWPFPGLTNCFDVTVSNGDYFDLCFGPYGLDANDCVTWNHAVTFNPTIEEIFWEDIDCNYNGVPDDIDIADGTSFDDDGNGVPDECEGPGTGYLPVFTIEKTHNSYQGQYEYVSITTENVPLEMGGFDFLIAYDASALAFTGAEPGQLLEDCGWEYFTYRHGAVGNCGDACPSGLLRIIAIANTNNGPNQPSCYGPPDTDPYEMARMDYLVTNDRTFECMYTPIRFFWDDCSDNSISSVDGEVLYVSDHVYDFEGTEITDSTYGFPTYFGIMPECLEGGGPDKPTPIQFIDFVNGGIDIVCADSIDDRGDINLNGIANEVADAVLYTNYFVYGLPVFIAPVPQTAASDVNADGITLSVADLVYQIRIIVGDAQPYPRLNPIHADFTLENSILSIDAEIGAAFVVVEGNIAPSLMAENMEFKYAYDIENNQTRILVYSMEKDQTFLGEFLGGIGDRIETLEMASYEGTPIVVDLLPDKFELYQNYPNPFNPITTISFAVPNSVEYELTIYNTLGQTVEIFNGNADPGIVEVDWDASDFSSGVYFYKLSAGSFIDKKKMILIK